MGTDIHCYIEYTHPTYKKSNGIFKWHGFGSGNFGSRCYPLFDALFALQRPGEICGDRNIPQDISNDTRKHYMLDISDDGISESDDDYYRRITFDQAISWIDPHSRIEVDENGFLNSISCPDYHSDSWLTADEFDQAIDSIESVIDPEYHAMVSICRTYEKFGYTARIVFWFDN